MKRTYTLLAVFTLVLGCTAAAAGAADAPATKPQTAVSNSGKPAAVHNVGVAEFEKLRADKKNVVLDVRTPREFAAGHMPGAVNIDFNAPDFAEKVAKLDPSKTYLVHCAGGVRSSKACTKLKSLSFTSLYNLEGGMKEWEKAGHKPEK